MDFRVVLTRSSSGAPVAVTLAMQAADPPAQPNWYLGTNGRHTFKKNCEEIRGRNENRTESGLS